MSPEQIYPQEINPEVRYAKVVPTKGGSYWGPRIIPDIELILIISGVFRYVEVSDNKTHLIHPGEVLLIEPDHNHVFDLPKENGEGLMVCIHMEPVRGACWSKVQYLHDPQPEVVIRPENGEEIELCFRRAADIMDGQSRYRDALLSTVAKEIWLRLCESWSGALHPKADARMKEIIAWIHENLHRPISRSDLAKQFHLAPEYINQIFRRHLGMRPVEYINRERCYYAYRLLKQSDCTVQEVSERCGFSDPFYFSRTFRKYFGRPPSTLKS